MNNIESNTGEIVMYQPDETIRLEVRVEDETVWLSQAQMAELFGTKRQAITKHLQNIYECDELKKEATSSILELVRKEGNRTVKRKVEFYKYLLRWTDFRRLRADRQSYQTGKTIHHPYRQLYRRDYTDDAKQARSQRISHHLHPSAD